MSWTGIRMKRRRKMAIKKKMKVDILKPHNYLVRYKLGNINLSTTQLVLFLVICNFSNK